MAFMSKKIERNVWYEIDGDWGTTLVPVDVIGNPLEDGENLDDLSGEALTEYFGEYYEGLEVYSVTRVTGWAFRLSADGYMDCTEWTGVFDTAKEAWEACNEMYDSDDPEDDPDSEDVSIQDLT
jgi:hypothetical protein